MIINHNERSIDLDPPPQVLLSLSGGADSASLFYLLCTHFPEVEIKLFTAKDIKKCFDYYCALDVAQWMRERFPDAKILDHITVDYDEADPHWMDKAQKIIDDPNDNYNQGLVSSLGVSKLLQIDKLKADAREQNPGYIFMYGMTCNPPVDEMIAGDFFDLAERRRDPIQGNLPKPVNHSPYLHVDKKFVSGVYQDYGLIESLLPLTASCVGSFDQTAGFTEPCKQCFWCHERYWAFGQY